jgi:hypothetical protein
VQASRSDAEGAFAAAAETCTIGRGRHCVISLGTRVMPPDHRADLGTGAVVVTRDSPQRTALPGTLGARPLPSPGSLVLAVQLVAVAGSRVPGGHRGAIAQRRRSRPWRGRRGVDRASAEGAGLRFRRRDTPRLRSAHCSRSYQGWPSSRRRSRRRPWRRCDTARGDPGRSRNDSRRPHSRPVARAHGEATASVHDGSGLGERQRSSVATGEAPEPSHRQLLRLRQDIVVELEQVVGIVGSLDSA